MKSNPYGDLDVADAIERVHYSITYKLPLPLRFYLLAFPELSPDFFLKGPETPSTDMCNMYTVHHLPPEKLK